MSHINEDDEDETIPRCEQGQQPNINYLVEDHDNFDTVGVTSPYKSSSTNYHHHRTMITPDQEEQLRTLLQKHHQLLLQQAVLAVRAANAQRRNRYGGGGGSIGIGAPTGVHHPLASSLLPNDTVDDGTGYGNRTTSPTTASHNNTTTTTRPPLSPYAEFVHCNESGDDIAEILDSSVGMLLDLDENRKDAIRYQIQCESSWTFRNTSGKHNNHDPLHSDSLLSSTGSLSSPQRSLYAEFFHERPPSTSSTMRMMVTQSANTGSSSSSRSSSTKSGGSTNRMDRRLTRAQFSKKLLEQSLSYEKVKTVFNIRGLHNLMSTFNLLDRCVEGVQKGDNRILEIETVCTIVINDIFHECKIFFKANDIPYFLLIEIE
jgi:hypothetical protein